MIIVVALLDTIEHKYTININDKVNAGILRSTILSGFLR